MEIMEDTNSNSQVRISRSFASPHDSLMFLYVLMWGMLLRSVTGLEMTQKTQYPVFYKQETEVNGLYLARFCHKSSKTK